MTTGSWFTKAEYIGADQLPSFVFRLQLCAGCVQVTEYGDHLGPLD